MLPETREATALTLILKRRGENILYMAGHSGSAIFPSDIKQWEEIEEAWRQMLLNSMRGEREKKNPEI